MANNRYSILASFAHPDDEAFGCGGTLARYAAQGADVHLVCATRGDVGEIADPALAGPDSLPHVREQELRCAARIMGLPEPILLGYRDSGMAGTADNFHPRAFANVPADEVVARLVGLMRELRPRAVITFDPNGGYGHPDHMAIHRHTVAAFHAAGDPDRFPGQGPPWRPERLFYTAFPRSFFREIRERLLAMGVTSTPFDNLTPRPEEMGWPDEMVNVVVDVAAQIDAKWGALACHRTQIGNGNPVRQLPEETVRRLFSKEYFYLASPALPNGTRLTDLFAPLPQ